MALMSNLGYGTPVQFGTLQGYVKRNKRNKITRLYIARHPLWEEDHPEWQAALNTARMEYPGPQPEGMNPFRALRRPADYV